MSTTRAAHTEPSLITFSEHPPRVSGAVRRWLARGQNFVVEWIEASSETEWLEIESDHEMFLLVFGAPASVRSDARDIGIAPRSVCVLPGAVSSIRLVAGGSCAILASQRRDLAQDTIINHARYETNDARIVASTPKWMRGLDRPRIEMFDIDKIAAPKDSPRLKMFQSETLSINWAEYAGPRDPALLSPHSHATFEQGSLGLVGDFVHHLRWPWGRDSREWKTDRHVQLTSPSLMVVPPEVVHTSEGIGAGQHLLIDIFSPPRRDFIEKNWVANSSSYTAPD